MASAPSGRQPPALRTGSAPAVTFARQPIRAGRRDAQPISVQTTRALPCWPVHPTRGLAGGARPTAPPSPTSVPPGSADLRVPARRLSGGLMASDGLRGALTAVLGGRGLLVQNCDSGPAGEPPAPVRLRKNVCYVVLAVFLNEQVSVRPAGPPPRSPGLAASPGREQRTYRQQPQPAGAWLFPVLQSTFTLRSETCAVPPCGPPNVRGRKRRVTSLLHPTRPQFLEGRLPCSSSILPRS